MVWKSWNYEWIFENFGKFNFFSFFACQDLLDEFAPPPTFKNDAMCLRWAPLCKCLFTTSFTVLRKFLEEILIGLGILSARERMTVARQNYPKLFIRLWILPCSNCVMQSLMVRLKHAVWSSYNIFHEVRITL